MVKQTMHKLPILALVLFMISVASAFGAVGSSDGSAGILTHTSTATLEPEWSAAGQVMNYDVTIGNIGDPIDEVRIFRALDYENFDCEPLAGWQLVEGLPWYDNDLGGNTVMCWYYTLNASFNIDDGETQYFEFSARTPDTSDTCNLEWKFETRDEASQSGGDWNAIFASTGIDSSVPEIHKIVEGPQDERDGTCPPGQGELCWVSGETVVGVHVEDHSHPLEDEHTEDYCESGLSYCKYRIIVDGDAGDWIDVPMQEGDLDVYFDVVFEEDSNHELQVECMDISGNMLIDNEMFKVDDTAPETELEFTGPYINRDGVEWIDGVSRVVLTAVDPDPTGYSCNIGDVETYYREYIVNDKFCYGNVQELPAPLVAVDMPYTLYTEPFGMEESCHRIDYFSVDALGNEEQHKVKFVFVDKTPPLLEKVNDERMQDRNDEQYDLVHWTTSDMDVTFTCVDQLPHPSEGEELCMKVSYDLADDGYLTEEYCDIYNGVMDEGYCCLDIGSMPENTFVFNFNENEESLHDLEYFCRDAVEKSTDVHTQYYRVDDTAPVITKEMIGLHAGDCPPVPGSDDVCYVGVGGGVAVTVVDPDPTGMSCNIEEVACIYHVWWDVDADTCDAADGSFDELNGCLIDLGRFTDYTEIIFGEDSTHTLDIYCEDGLGNAVQDVEVFRVDHEPPVTTKEYGEPRFAPYYPNGPQWITTSTPIYLSAWDEKIGVEYTYYTIEQVEDFMCEYPIETCQPESVWDFGQFDVYVEPVTALEQSCHRIAYYSVDYLGNTEEVKYQCAYVDTTAPTTVKTIGEPKVVRSEMCEEDQQLSVGANIASVGDEIATVNFPEGPATGVGVAFDGEFLYYTYTDSRNLYKIRPDGSGHAVIPTTGIVETGIGAMAYDAGRGMLWAGMNGCNNNGAPVYLIDPATGAATHMFDIPSQYLSYCFDDGIAYDATDDSIWYSDDVNDILVHMGADGTFLGTIDVSTIDSRLSRTSGVAIGGENFYLGTNGNEVTLRVHRDSLTLLDEFVNTGFRIEDMECDPNTYAPVEVMWIRDAYAGKVKAYEIEPGTCGLGGQPSEPQCEDTVTYITQETEITLECNDGLPHPVGHEALHYRYRTSDDCMTWGEWTAWMPQELLQKSICIDSEDVSCVPEDETLTFTFPEDSCHQLEYYCEDILGNTETVQTEIDIVDTVAPVIDFTISEPQYGDCPVEEEGDVCYTDAETLITVVAVDPQPHPVNDVTCDWSYRLESEDFMVEYVMGEGLTTPFEISGYDLPEGIVELTFTCRDALGNEDSESTVLHVDHTAPQTTLSHGLPYYTDGESDWISVSTPIELSAEDLVGVTASGVAYTEYRVTLLDSYEPCYNPEEYQEVEGSGDWETYEGEFTISEDSCHLVEFRSVDNVGKTEQVRKWFVFVDDNDPVTNKIVYEPKEPMSTENKQLGAVYYPELNPQGENVCDDENPDKCLEVTKLTPINLACEDSDPHPSGAVAVSFKVGFDGDDITEQYCDEIEGEYDSETGYCHVADGLATFYFQEESWHKLEYYCVDRVGNSGGVDVEYFKVEGTAFTIELNKKWNLISVPVKLLDNSMDKVFEGLEDVVVSVWAFDGYDWYVYTPDGNPMNDDITTMEPGWGYWVLTRDAGMLTIGGSLFSPAMTPPSVPIVAGWNLIGYYGADEETSYTGPESMGGTEAGCTLNSLGVSVWDKGWTSLWSYWEPYNVGSSNPWISLTDWDLMHPGAGYWLFAQENGIYAPTTSCSFVFGPMPI